MHKSLIRSGRAALVLLRTCCSASELIRAYQGDNIYLGNVDVLIQQDLNR